MLGKLAKKLRLLGFDTLYFSEIQEEEILRRIGSRIFLTRDKELYIKATRFGMRTIYVEDDNWRAQLRKLILKLPIIENMKPFTRCIECNELLVKATPEEVKGKVPEYVYKTTDEFKVCPKCGRVYWKGSHLEWIGKDMEKLVGRWSLE